MHVYTSLRELDDRIRDLEALQFILKGEIGTGSATENAKKLAESETVEDELRELRDSRLTVKKRSEEIRKVKQWAAFFAQSGGGQREITNDKRSVEERRADTERKNQEQRRRSQAQLDAFGPLTLKYTIKY